MPHYHHSNCHRKSIKTATSSTYITSQPLLPQLPKRAIVFLEAKGFEVIRLQSLNLTDNIKIGQLPLKPPRPYLKLSIPAR